MDKGASFLKINKLNDIDIKIIKNVIEQMKIYQNNEIIEENKKLKEENNKFKNQIRENQ